MCALDMHSEPLYVLNGLAPNGYPDAYCLRDTLVKLDQVYGVFTEARDGSAENNMTLNNRAMLAADRWRIMTKHCLMLNKKQHRGSLPGP